MILLSTNLNYNKKSNNKFYIKRPIKWYKKCKKAKDKIKGYTLMKGT